MSNPDVMSMVLVLAAFGAVLYFVGAPLRPGAQAREVDRKQVLLEDLQAQKQAKYSEIRDAALDRSMGKLSEQDFKLIDRRLRAEAAQILQQLDEIDN